jgi:hypothetical protein
VSDASKELVVLLNPSIFALSRTHCGSPSVFPFRLQDLSDPLTSSSLTPDSYSSSQPLPCCISGLASVPPIEEVSNDCAVKCRKEITVMG